MHCQRFVLASLGYSGLLIHDLRQEVSVWPSHGHEGGRENLILLGGKGMLRLHTMGC